jgi:hypothetical protein
VTGKTGADGETGATGQTGATGSDGAGSQGLQGVQGTIGAPGSDGADGVDGTNGTNGIAGTNGTNGTNGTDGAPGAPGPARVAQYAYVYNLAAQTVAIEAPVLFDANGAMTSGITHAAGTAGITLVNAGAYKVTFSASGTEVNQMALFANGVVVPGTVYGSGAGTQQNTGQAIVTFGAGDVLTLRNHSSAAAVGLAAVVGGTQANTNASVVIEKVD